MVFQPGQSGNPSGYKKNTRRKGNAEIFHEIKNRGYLDPLLTLAKIQHESQNEGIRASAAASLAPYTHPKLQSIPVPRFISTPIEIPVFQTITDASTFLAKVTTLVGRGELDLDFGKELSAMASAWIDAKKASEFEERLLIVEQSVGIQSPGLAVTGGLPRLPGTAVIMPDVVNGHDPGDGTTDSTPSDINGQGPEP
jgi:hypothetical protein